MGTGYCHGCMERIAAYPCPRCGYSPKYSPSPYALQPGTILNRKYLVGKVLGQGGFGITYIGMDLQLQRKIAIKEYYPTGFVSRKTGTSNVVWYASAAAQEARHSGQEMFLKEARKMSKVSDIGPVVQVFNVFQENGTAYICMDFIEGHTLLVHLKKSGPLSWDQTKKIFLPIIKTMDHVHRLGLIHRDLSPDNLMIQPGGGVKILDLGAAKDLNLNSGKSSMQVAKSGFSPLEQYIQTGNSGSWTDVYAMAATMYYTLTGVIPPSAIDRMDNDTIRWDLPQLQKLPPAVCNALKRAMAVRSGERTQTMEAFFQELQGNVRANPKPQKRLITAVALAAVAAVAIGISSSRGKEARPGKESQNSAVSVPKQDQSTSAAMQEWQERIDELIASCTMEVYDYRNGARMELYFDDQDNERLRIFINDEGRDEFLFLAEYDSNGKILEQLGFEYQELARHTIWNRNADGNTTELLDYKADGVLIEKTEINYDSQGREISRITVDGNGRILRQGSSTYDAAGRETYSGTNENEEHFVYTYTADGNLLESTTTDQNGKQVSRTVYQYDKDGKETEYLSYDENDQVTYRSVYHYKGDLQVGYTSYSYYADTEYTYDYEYIFGPRDIQFGHVNKDPEYGSETEYVQDMRSSWRLRLFSHNSGLDATYMVSYYNWNWESTGDVSFDEDGNMVSRSETMYDASGKEIGSKSFRYNDNGSYSITLYNTDYATLSREEYSSGDSLLSKTEYQYDANGEQTGMIETEYGNDGSYSITEMDAFYHTKASWTYDSAGTLVSMAEYSYDSAGNRTGSVLTYYYYDGSYTVTVKDANSRTVSENTYDASGKLIK